MPRISGRNPLLTTQTKFLSKVAFAILASLAALGCSVYESGGRKFLEKQAFEYAGVSAASNLKTCHTAWASTGDWRLDQDTGRAFLYVKQNDLRVITQEQSAKYGCEFQFESPDELQAKRESAVHLTLLHQSLGID